LWLGAARPVDVVKFVVADGTDLQYALNVLDAYSTHASVHISPCITSDVLGATSRLWLQDIWKFCVKHNFVYGLQIHKVVFGNKRGV
jgi:hypothetical protein